MWVLYLILALVVALVVILCVIFVHYVRYYWKYLEVPHESPKEALHLVKALLFRDHEHDTEAFDKLYWRFKGIAPFCGFYDILEPRVLILEHELVKQILIRDFSNFNDRGLYHNCKFDPLSGNLYSLHNNYWKEMRMKLEPTFYKTQMSTMFGSICAESDNLMQSFDEALVQSGKTNFAGIIEVKYLMRRYVLSTIANCVFGLDAVQQQKYPFAEFDTMTQLALTTRRHCDFIYYLVYRHPKLGRHLHITVTKPEVRSYFLTLIQDIVSQRDNLSASTPPRQDYLQLLIDIKSQELSTHVTETDAEAKELKQHLIDELAAGVFGFLKSGYEPTARTLAFILYELARNPEVQEQVRREIKQMLRKMNGELNFEIVLQLKYLGKVISETLRMHPITPYLTRRTFNDYRIPYNNKYFIPKDTLLIIPTHAMHNDPDYFPQPQEFNPDRFDAAANKTREQCIWMGFGDGPRNCIGLHFAQMQMRIAIVRLLLKYKFNLSSEQIVINGNEGGLLLQVKPLQVFRESGQVI